MIVMKFGGTSIGSSDQIKKTVNIIKSKLSEDPIIVLSAVGGVTDLLLKSFSLAINKGVIDYSEVKEKHLLILKDLKLPLNLLDNEFLDFEKNLDILKNIKKDNLEILDNLLSFGEKCSVKILSSYLTLFGIKSRYYYSYDLGMLTNSNFGSAEILSETYELLEKSISLLNKNYLSVITGYIGQNKEGKITTLGRGGSDYSASIIAAAINAKRIEIWTDVDGVMTTNPKIVKNAKKISEISFEEASELATFGGKILHPKTILPAINKNIPVCVLNSFNPEYKGTIVTKNNNKKELTAISYKQNVSLIKIKSTRMLYAHGFLMRLFKVFDDNNISIDLISTSEVSVSLTFNDFNNLNEVISKISEFGKVDLFENKSIISIIGQKLKYESGFVSKITGILAKEQVNIDMISYGASEINICFVVDDADLEKAVLVLHKELFEI